MNLKEEIIKLLNSSKSMTDEVKNQVVEYLMGNRKEFDYDWQDLKFYSGFQEKVLRACANIAFGQTTNYGDIAVKIGSPRAARAVGSALRKNPYPIFIPCHRVVCSNGEIGKYIFGNVIKRRLLKFEKNLVKKS